MSLRLITAPTELPLTLAEVKEHLRVQDSDEDGMIDLYISAATAYAESFMGRALIDQIWEVVLDTFPTDDLAIKIPRPPLIAVSSVNYDDVDGFQQTLATSEYDVDTASQPGWIVPATSWPATIEAINAVRIRFRAGYVDMSDSPSVGEVPNDILNGILLIVGTLYAVRETVIVGQTPVSMPWSAEQLLRRHRIETSLA
jgi:uncharacterized phiE125 gp8 family phage protein